MEIWVNRAGVNGRFGEIFLSKGIVGIDYPKLGNLSKIKSKEDLVIAYREAYPEFEGWKLRIAMQVGQAWRFLKEFSIGDLVLVPIKTEIWLGRIASNYIYSNAEPFHLRKVKWLKSMHRNSFDPDIKQGLGATNAVFQIHKEDFERRIAKLYDL